jgi:hypothetical protein
MPALVAGIHVFDAANKTWMAGTSLDKPGHDEKRDPNTIETCFNICIPRSMVAR